MPSPISIDCCFPTPDNIAGPMERTNPSQIGHAIFAWGP